MRVTAAHWTIFMDEAEKNPHLITNKFNGAQGKAEGNALWQNLCVTLNSQGYGQKNVNEWRKAVTDWKSKTKCKAAKIRAEQNKTGGGPQNYIPLTPLEERLINLIGKKALDGDNVPELGCQSYTLPTSSRQSDPNDVTAPLSNENICENILEQEIIHDHSYELKSKDTNVKETCAGKDVNKKRRKIGSTQTSELLELSRKTYMQLEKIQSHLGLIATSVGEVAKKLKRED